MCLSEWLSPTSFSSHRVFSVPSSSWLALFMNLLKRKWQYAVSQAVASPLNQVGICVFYGWVPDTFIRAAVLHSRHFGSCELRGLGRVKEGEKTSPRPHPPYPNSRQSHTLGRSIVFIPGFLGFPNSRWRPGFRRVLKVNTALQARDLPTLWHTAAHPRRRLAGPGPSRAHHSPCTNPGTPAGSGQPADQENWMTNGTQERGTRNWSRLVRLYGHWQRAMSPWSSERNNHQTKCPRVGAVKDSRLGRLGLVSMASATSSLSARSSFPFEWFRQRGTERVVCKVKNLNRNLKRKKRLCKGGRAQFGEREYHVGDLALPQTARVCFPLSLDRSEATTKDCSRVQLLYLCPLAQMLVDHWGTEIVFDIHAVPGETVHRVSVNPKCCLLGQARTGDTNTTLVELEMFLSR